MADTIRRDTKQAVATLLQTTPGLKTVYTFRNKQVDAQAFPFCIVTLPKSKEKPLSETRPIGKKRLDFNVQLEIYDQDVTPDASGELTFDDLLDDIDGIIRSQPNLNGATVGTTGVVLASAVDDIDTTVAPPMNMGQTVSRMAVKQFTVTVQLTG